jgi:hypothetical protein
MPRNGSGNYAKPYDDVVDGTTIEPIIYNGFVNDVASDLDTPRPVVVGGTGAANAATALFNLGGETAAQSVTDDYSTYVFLPGSFRSAAGVTNAPTANAFVGTAWINEALANPPTNANVMLQARDMTTGTVYKRARTAGSWGAWAVEAPTAAAGGSTTQLQYNNAGVLGGISGSAVGAGGALTINTLFKTDANGVLYTGGIARNLTDSGLFSSTTLTSLFTLPVGASKHYIIDCTLFVTMGAGGIRAALTGSAGITSLNINGYLLADSTVKAQGSATAYSTLLFNTTSTQTTGVVAHINGCLSTTTTPGSIQIAVAQSASNVNPLGVLRGSWMRIMECP